MWRISKQSLTALALACTATPPALAQTTGAASAGAAPSGGGCLAPIAQGTPDPAVRNVHLHVTSDPRYLGVTMCIASNEPNGFQSVAATIGLLGSDGGLINSISTTYNNVGPLEGGAGNAPKLILPFSTAANIDPKYHDALADRVLVTLQVVICQEKLPACNSGPARTEVLTLPAVIDHDSPAPPARR